MKNKFLFDLQYIFINNKKIFIISAAVCFLLITAAVLFYIFPYQKLYGSYSENHLRIQRLKQDIQKIRESNAQFEQEKQKLANLFYEYEDTVLVYQTEELEKIKLDILREQDIGSLSAKLESELQAVLQEHFDREMQDGRFVVLFSRELKEQDVKLNTFIAGEIMSAEQVLLLPIEIEVEGKYPSVLEVISFLEKQSYLTEINNLEMELVQDDMNSDGVSVNWVKTAGGDITAKLTLNVISLPTPEGKRTLEDIKNCQFYTDNPFEGTVIEIDLPQDVVEDQSASNDSLSYLPIKTSEEDTASYS